MAKNPHFHDTAANAAVNAATALANSGKLRIYDGTQPAANAAITTQNLLAELTLNATAFGAASGGIAAANAITGANAALTGTASWFRVMKSDGTTMLWDGTVGVGTFDLVINSTAISSGAAVTCSALSFTLTE